MSGQGIRTGRPDTPSDGGGTWSVAGCPNDEARLAHFKSMIRTTYPNRICYHPECDVHECRIAWRRVSSWGIRMELIRIALHASCHPG